MNKDVIYLEPEDDITDVISRLKTAKQKIVALVPPQKLGALRSIINLKLVAKTAKELDKALVIVTTDPVLVKTSVAVGLPVAKTLSSRPTMPTEAEQKSRLRNVETVEEEKPSSDSQAPLDSASSKDSSSSKDPASLPTSEPTAASPEIIESIDESELTDQKSEQDPVSKSSKSKKIPSLDKYRKWIIIGIVLFLVLTVASLWALFIAPSAHLKVAIRTISSGFSENVTLVTKDAAPSEGKFLIEEHKLASDTTIEFAPTGKKDKGEKATGSLAAYAYFREKGNLIIPAGTIFTSNGLKFTSVDAATLTYDGSNACDNAANIADIVLNGCRRSLKLSVSAVEPGEKYNIPSTKDWKSSLARLVVYSENAMNGGTTKLVTVVQQSDIDQAKKDLDQKLKTDNMPDKEKLLSKLPADLIAIETSFKTSLSDPVISPAIDQEVADNGKAKLKVTTTSTIFAIDRLSVENYIKSKAEAALSSDQKFYQLDPPFFERLVEQDGHYLIKLKSTTKSGPKVTEQDILEKSKGRKIGEVQRLLKSINGVKDVRIDTSYPWVYAIPDDPNKIQITINIEE